MKSWCNAVLRTTILRLSLQISTMKTKWRQWRTLKQEQNSRSSWKWLRFTNPLSKAKSVRQLGNKTLRYSWRTVWKQRTIRTSTFRRARPSPTPTWQISTFRSSKLKPPTCPSSLLPAPKLTQKATSPLICTKHRSTMWNLRTTWMKQ